MDGGPVDLEKLRNLVMRVLDSQRTLAIATLRPDGWPQATIVGFVHEELTLYFVVARTSQKFANVQRERRVSLAVGASSAGCEPVRGLSMAANVREVDDPAEIERINLLAQVRYPKSAIFAPRAAACAVLRADPMVISLVDESEGFAQPVLLKVRARTELEMAD